MIENNSDYTDLHLRLADKNFQDFQAVYGHAVVLRDLSDALEIGFPSGMRTLEMLEFVSKTLRELARIAVTRMQEGEAEATDEITGSVIDMTTKPEETKNDLPFLPDLELTLESQFVFIKLCKEVDSCRDLETLRDLVKRSSKLGMIYQQLCGNLFKKEMVEALDQRNEQIKKKFNLE